MALTNCGRMMVGNIGLVPQATTAYGIDLNSSTTNAATVFIADKSATIDTVGIYCTGTNGTFPAYTISIQGVTDGRKPDGTIKGGGSPCSVSTSSFSAGTYAEYSLANSYSATAGEVLAVVIKSASADGSNYISVAHTYYYGGGASSLSPYATTTTDESTWTGLARIPTITCRYADGSMPPGMCASDNVADNSGFTSGFRGIKWTPPFGARLSGFWFGGRFNTSSFDFDVELYTGSGSSPTLTRSYSDEHVFGTTANGVLFFPFGPVTLSASTVYRLVLEPTNSTGFTDAHCYEFFDDDSLKAMFGPVYYTTASTPPTWTDYDNGTDGYWSWPMCPEYDQIDVAAASGGGGRKGYWKPGP